MSLPIIKVHWLEQSRAFRVLWLLDHLKLEYEIIPYKRDANFRAPPELKKIHPLGRSPLLEIEDRETGKKKILAESGFIFQYILQHFDHSHVLMSEDSDIADQINYYLFYSEGSLQPPLMMEFVLSKVRESGMPFPISYLAGKVASKISQAYSQGEMKNQFDFVEGEISKNNGYLVDGKLSGADILMSFPLQMAFQRNFATPEEYPAISKWLKTITSEGSYDISKEKAQALGSKF
ncbi:gtt1p [Saccharomyces arboricola H-6]|uniref:glutathione transferase n=1 Tax=Saccharomyces arboricola (strain H-6 / AS 2.3317 / CBS 10644) TaxID=1160507 RepID=J8PMA8_SACAR|nr:gtt1p [Saccharomyces arboricola H-6]